MVPYIIILKVRKFHQPTANHFGTTRQKSVGGGGGGTLNMNMISMIMMTSWSTFKSQHTISLDKALLNDKRTCMQQATLGKSSSEAAS